MCILLAMTFGLAVTSCGSTRVAGDGLDDCAYQAFRGSKLVPYQARVRAG
jgi:hypothetical protein